jgi:type I restriction enzyme, S subunit
VNEYPVRPLGDALARVRQSTSVAESESYRITGIYSFGKGLINRNTIQGSETAYKYLTPLRTGQLVMSKLNAWEGALSVATSDFDGTYVSPEYPVFEIDQESADADYIRHLVSWPALWERLTPRGSMVRRKRTAPETLLATLVPLPGVAEQLRVAARISAITDDLDQIFQLRDRSQRLSEEYINVTLRNIHENVQLGTVLTEAYDWVPILPDGRYHTVGIYSHGKGLFRRPVIDGTETQYHRYNRLHKDQFIYSKLFGREGALAIVENGFDDLLTSHEFPTFNIDQERVDINYLSHVVRWPGLHRKLRDQGTGVGSRRQRVNVGRLLATEVPLPSLPEQRELSIRLNRVEQARQMARDQATNVPALHASVLDAAFTGQM